MNRDGAARLARMDRWSGSAMAAAVKSGDELSHEIAYDWLQDKGANVESVLKIDECYFIKTIADYYVGRLVHQTHDWLVLTEASWIPDTGRLNEFLRTGRPTECEPMPHGVIVNIGSITAISPWPFAPLKEVR